MAANLDRQIARAIVLAQVASDGGKNIREIKNIADGSSKAWDLGYSVKDKYIIEAMSKIRRMKNSNFRYYVAECSIYGEQAIVYFNFKVGEEKFQVSFHTYSKEIIGFISKRRYETVWDKKSSREAVVELVKAYAL